MKVNKKVSLGAYAKQGEDYKNGDILTFANAGEQVEGEFGTQNVFKINLESGEQKNLSVNQTSINHLIEVYGDDTEGWVDKEFKVWVITQNVAGKFRKVTYLTGPEQELEGNES